MNNKKKFSYDTTKLSKAINEFNKALDEFTKDFSIVEWAGWYKHQPTSFLEESLKHHQAKEEFEACAAIKKILEGRGVTIPK